ncbi:MAG: nitroreductase family protein [Vicinamibacterales bacterium]
MAGGPIAFAYHDRTKHHLHRYARSLGYLDWATQPDPFRRFAGAPLIELARSSAAPDTPYEAIFGGAPPAAAMSLDSIGTFLRYSLGLSAWKQHGTSRWALRVNPSSGNLHPTEAYVAWGGALVHYAPREHALEKRADLGLPVNRGGLLVGLTSIHWREAWKYGERAFRYCQHDAGHAIAALRLAAAMLGWTLVLLPWRHVDIERVLGTERETDFVDAELEEAECIAWVSADGSPPPEPQAITATQWYGRANRLSPDHAEWPVIEEVARGTRRAGGIPMPKAQGPQPTSPLTLGPLDPRTFGPSAAQIILRRRSALAFDPRGHLRREAFARMLGRLRPGAPPWDALWWPPHLHLVLFVHRVQDVTPGIYACARTGDAVAAMKAAMRPEFIWEPAAGIEGLFLLAPVDTGATANRLSCNQDIAEDGFFSLGMLARFEQPLRDYGDWFYRCLFWEAGMIGQVLYLEAEAAGGRATGIGCFFDDPVHELLGLSGHAWQSLYHFSMGLPLDDARLSTESGYDCESRSSTSRP